MTYDLIIIGGGPAGYLAAERAGHAGLSTLVIEKRAFGGCCLNEGCIPSKAFLYSAKIYDYTKHGDKYGVTVSSSSIDHKAVVARKNKVVRTLVTGIKAALKADNVTAVESEAFIKGKTDESFCVKAGNDEYTGKYLLIATGSMPVIPPIKGLKEAVESGFAITNREILDIDHIPESLVIIGGGVIGLEMASYFNSVGSKVTVVEMLDKIAGPTDRDISAILLKNYEKKGIVFKLGCKVTEIKASSVVFEKNGVTEEVSAEKALMSIGRRAVTTGFGLENIGVATERGAVITDYRMQTNIANVYAAGDVNGKSMLAHTAYREAEVAISNILGNKDIMRYNAIPSVIYTNPEVGSVGETEETAKAKGLDFDIVNLTMKYSGRYVAENEGGDGICKILVNKKFGTVIGISMISNYASEIIYGASLMVDKEMKLDDVKKTVFPHPTVCEIIREGIFQFK